MTSPGSHVSCRLDAAIYDDRKHICWDKPRVFLGSIGQFCAAFYHVPARNAIPHCCLDVPQCKVGQRILNGNGFGVHPRTVVAVIKCEDKDGAVTYEARYSNCYDDKMHAEDYFRLDVERGALRELLNENKVKMITIYLTFQPCHLTVKGTLGAREEHSCCETLLALFRDRQFSTRRNNIEICIKPTHMYKADWKVNPVNEEQNTAITNATRGIKMLMKEGIEITRMEETDWKYLLQLVEDKAVQSFIPSYQGSYREMLDKEIGEILSDLQMDNALEQPSTHECDTGFGIYDDRKHILKRQDAPNGTFLGKPAQICAAFYHIYEGQLPLPSQQSQCLDTQSCFTSRKSRKLQCLTYDPPKTMVAVVKCEGRGETVLYEARYTDCCGFGVSAEEFFVRDARKGELRTIINTGCTTKITMYTAWPPRHKSALDTRDPRDYSCCAALVELYFDILKPKKILFSVKVAHIYREGWPLYEDNIQVGIKTLLCNGIIVTRMVWDDWKYLFGVAGLPFPNYASSGSQGCAWDWKFRKMLDEAIGSYLTQIEQEAFKWLAGLRHICPFLRD